MLDQANLTYWRLDEHLRVRGTQASVPTLFQPVLVPGDPVTTESLTGSVQPIGTPLTSPSLRSPMHPVSIEPGPDGGVLILDSDPIRGYSLVHLFDGDQLLWSVSLADSVEVIDPRDPTSTPQQYSLLGFDFVYATGPLATAPGAAPLFYIVDSEGKQVVAFDLETADVGGTTEHTFLARPDFLPLRRWDGKALVRAGADIWYDFSNRWIPVEVFTECRFASSGTLTTSTGFTDLLTAGPSGNPACRRPRAPPSTARSPAASGIGCFLDAEIPNGTSVSVRARASDDPDLLLQAHWLPQPVPYERGGGPELPWYDPWADQRDPVTRALPDHTGTFELLFQQVIGRYLEVELTLTGNGRSTPLLRTLRAWYPRFSYSDHYLPAIYPASDSPDRFLDRFLANFEGFYTAIEERIEHSHLLLDARTTLAEDLPWLACWFGLALDPQWTEAQRRFLIRNVDRYYRMRGTVRRGRQHAAGVPGEPPRRLDLQLLRWGRRWSPGHRAVPHPRHRRAGLRRSRPSRRRPRRTSTPGWRPPRTASTCSSRSTPRRDTLAMVQRIVDSAKPAHTLFAVRQLLRPVHRRAGPAGSGHRARHRAGVRPDGHRTGPARSRVPRLPAPLRHQPTASSPTATASADCPRYEPPSTDHLEEPVVSVNDPCVSISTGTLSPDLRVNYAYGMVLGLGRVPPGTAVLPAEGLPARAGPARLRHGVRAAGHHRAGGRGRRRLHRRRHPRNGDRPVGARDRRAHRPVRPPRGLAGRAGAGRTRARSRRTWACPAS